jgi:hypothetical protein
MFSMDEIERQNLLAQIKALQEQADTKIVDEKKVQNYIRETRLYSETPKDPFAHQYKLLYHPTIEPRDRTELMSPDALLGTIKDSRTLIFLQMDFSLLHRLYDMGMRSKVVSNIFSNLYYPWLGNMRLTSALGGNERMHQSFLEPAPVSYEGFSYWQERKMKKEAKKFNLRQYLPQNIGRGGEEGHGKTYV